MATYQRISCVCDGPIVVVTLLDAQVKRDELTEELRQELAQAADEFSTGQWVLDFRLVEFFSSAGVPPLLGLHRKLQSRRGRIALCNVKAAVADMFRVIHLIRDLPGQQRPFELAGDLGDAFARLRHLRSEVRDGVLIFRIAEKELHGEDLADGMGAEMGHRWQAVGAAHVVVDFTPVQVISTPCMRPLLNLRTQVRQNGGRVVFCSLSPAVTEIFEVTRMTSSNPANPSLFETAPDLNAALAMLR